MSMVEDQSQTAYRPLQLGGPCRLVNHQSSVTIHAMVKLAHFSDVHLTARRLGWTVRDVFGKRTTGWVNVNLLGRGGRFRHAPSVVDILRHDLATRGFDHLVFSGDATMLGFDTEMAAAAAALGVGDADAAAVHRRAGQS